MAMMSVPSAGMAVAEPERPLRVVLISWKTVEYEDDSWNSYVAGRQTYSDDARNDGGDFVLGLALGGNG